VLGGGGVAGIAWETGVLFGLADHGVDPTAADLVVGTSAGSAVGAQLLSGTPLGELYDRQAFPPEQPTEIAAEFDPQRMAEAWTQLLSQHGPGAGLRAAIGRYALTAATVPERARRAVIEARLPSHEWPDTPLQVVVVDAASGDPRVLTRDDGVPIVDAVAASCAVPGIWPPVTIGGRRYIDGGVRTAANIDLASGHDVVVVLEPVADFLGTEPAIKRRLTSMQKKSTLLRISPDDASVEAMGPNPLDPAAAPATARAGRAQADAVIDAVKEAWT
jgi:NTE family protein